MDLYGLHVNLERCIDELAAETARLRRVADAGDRLDLSWYAELHTIVCFLTAGLAVLTTLIESDRFTIAEVSRDTE